ncbi:MAG TPA: hypothetical protein VG013_05735 [Gemmataceae bacterium]|jgi:hypothetical protein|nr:hypothetical protein [Gemmataceae bacterium]
MNLTIPGVEKRLQDRYEQLVQEHTGHAHTAATGPRILPDEASSHAAAMAAWRFYTNPRTTFTRLAEPLVQAGCSAADSHCRNYALVDVDWSWLNYNHHASKTDRLEGPGHVLGYKLLSALLVSDQDGQPLAPLAAELLTAHGLFSSRRDRARRRVGTALDELADFLGFVQGLPLGKPSVFIIDQEADSVFHLRWWQRLDFLFLVRGDDDRKVRLDTGEEGKKGEELLLSALVRRLQRQNAFRRVREVQYEGRKVGQYVAEAAVVLDRPAWLHRTVDGKRHRLVRPGAALKLRLVVTELRDERGRLLARWYLLTNVPAEVDAATIALWYYWRWQIETYFRLLKSAGQQLEHWQQENGRLLFKRLLVASMACVLAWRLGNSHAPQAEEARRVVMSLSGRQMEHGKQYTLEGLLAGTWVLLAMMAILEQKPVSRLRQMADFVLRGSVASNSVSPLPLREAG